MKIEWPWKSRKITIEKDLNVVEKKLDALFQPVNPRPEFVRQLRAELVGEPEETGWFAQLNGNWRKGVLVAGGVVSFFAMVLGVIRFIIAILGLFQMNKQKAIEKPAAA